MTRTLLQQAVEAKQREAFEHWFSDAGEAPAAIARDMNGNYRLMQAYAAWTAWRAAWQSAVSALQQQEEPSGAVIPPAPPECETDDEKTAFAFGYWQGLHVARKQQEEPREVAPRDLYAKWITTYGMNVEECSMPNYDYLSPAEHAAWEAVAALASPSPQDFTLPMVEEGKGADAPCAHCGVVMLTSARCETAEAAEACGARTLGVKGAAMRKPDVLVPGWLAELGQDEAQKLCAFYARQCLADATTARCNGYGCRPADPQDVGSWYAAARRWLALRSALGVSRPDSETFPPQPTDGDPA